MSDRQNPETINLVPNQTFETSGTLNPENPIDVYTVELNQATPVLLEAAKFSSGDEEAEILVNFAADQDNDTQLDNSEIFFSISVDESDTDRVTLLDQVIFPGRYFVEAQLLNPSEASANYEVEVLAGEEDDGDDNGDNGDDDNDIPTELQFNLNQTSYSPGDTLRLVDAWVEDDDGYEDLAEVDFWLLRPDGEWQDLQDVTEFTPWSEDDDWANFQYSLDLTDYPAGQYTVWAQAEDISGATSNAVQRRFTIESEVSPANSPPTGLQFGLNQTTFDDDDDTLSLTEAWIQDPNGTSDLERVELWLLSPDGTWEELAQIRDFQAWSQDNTWASFDYSGEIGDDRPSGSYLVWAKGYDLSGAASNEASVSFELIYDD